MSAQPFTAWLKARLGTDRWVVANRLTPRLKDKGYTVALSDARFRDLREAWVAESNRKS